MKYTKGPWKWEDDKLVAANGDSVIDIFDGWLRVDPDGNQKIIQHAPDMYEALKDLIDLGRISVANGLDPLPINMTSRYFKSAILKIEKAQQILDKISEGRQS